MSHISILVFPNSQVDIAVISEDVLNACLLVKEDEPVESFEDTVVKTVELKNTIKIFWHRCLILNSDKQSTISHSAQILHLPEIVFQNNFGLNFWLSENVFIDASKLFWIIKDEYGTPDMREANKVPSNI